MIAPIAERLGRKPSQLYTKVAITANHYGCYLGSSVWGSSSRHDNDQLSVTTIHQYSLGGKARYPCGFGIGLCISAPPVDGPDRREPCDLVRRVRHPSSSSGEIIRVLFGRRSRKPHSGGKASDEFPSTRNQIIYHSRIRVTPRHRSNGIVAVHVYPYGIDRQERSALF